MTQDVKLITETGRPVKSVAVSGEAFTPSDSVKFDPAQVYVGTGGNLNVAFETNPDTKVSLVVQDGSYHPISVVRIYADSTASDIVLLR